MKCKAFWLVAQVGMVLLVGSISTLAQSPGEVHLRGSINDYTPASVGGPWQITGQWSLNLHGQSGSADFAASVTMVRSDLGVTDLNSPSQRHAHTHHILLANGTVTPIANGFRVTGAATITANGNFPPPFGPSSTLEIDVVGGNTVAPSNINLTLTGDAVVHFGSQPINGVVSNGE